VLILLSVAQFMVILDATVVNVALPSIGRSLHVTAGDLQWVVTAYVLLSGGLVLLGGRAADVAGRRRMFLAGLSVFTAASLASGLAPTAGALFGVVTEVVAVRPVLRSLEQHLYVLSTLALALMTQQLTAIEWGTESRPFPRLFDLARGGFDQQFWLPMAACIAVIVGLELLYRRTLVGRAFLAIAEDTYAARALGLPERRLRMASFALAGMIGALAGFAGGEMLLAFFGNAPMLTFYGFVPVALGGMGNNRGAVVAGLLLGLFQQAANFLVGGIFASVAVFAVFILVLLARPEGLAGAAVQRRV